MSTRTSARSVPWYELPPGVGRRPRNHAPEPLLGPPDVNYPSSDGRPMADNTLQFEWIAKVKGGLDIVFRDDPAVFVAGNLFWYPVEGRNRRRLAPDAMVVFGRPKGHRGSYIQHLEGGVGPQVVFEIWSPGNRKRVMDYKFQFYRRHGVREYYHFDPYKIRLDAWTREGEELRPVPRADGWVSPLLGIRFQLAEDLTVFAPDGRPFEDMVEIARRRDQAERAGQEATDSADRERLNAGRERLAAREATELADRERLRAERLAAQLRALGIEPEGGPA